MSGPVLYSVNPWYAHEISTRYCDGKHVVWCCEEFDSSKAATITSGAAIAPSSNPSLLYNRLHQDCRAEDKHSDLIRRYKTTFKRLAVEWLSTEKITKDEYDEICANLKPGAWRIWRPLLYIIPRAPIESAGRLKIVPCPKRASYGPELQILDLMPNEFDIMEFLP